MRRERISRGARNSSKTPKEYRRNFEITHKNSQKSYRIDQELEDPQNYSSKETVKESQTISKWRES